MKTPQEQELYMECLKIAEQHYRNIAGYVGDEIVKMADELYVGVVSEHSGKNKYGKYPNHGHNYRLLESAMYDMLEDNKRTPMHPNVLMDKFNHILKDIHD